MHSQAVRTRASLHSCNDGSMYERCCAAGGGPVRTVLVQQVDVGHNTPQLGGREVGQLPPHQCRHALVSQRALTLHVKCLEHL